MSGITLYCAGVVDTAALTCSTGWQAVVANAPFDPSMLDPELMALMFAGGFFVMVPVWAAAFGVKKLIQTLH